MGRLFKLVVLAGIATLVALMFPDVKRYLKMSAM
jgi:hypothetical protein